MPEQHSESALETAVIVEGAEDPGTPGSGAVIPNGEFFAHSRVSAEKRGARRVHADTKRPVTVIAAIMGDCLDRVGVQVGSCRESDIAIPEQNLNPAGDALARAGPVWIVMGNLDMAAPVTNIKFTRPVRLTPSAGVYLAVSEPQALSFVLPARRTSSVGQVF